MSKDTIKTQKKALELRQQQAETEKAELDLAAARLQHSITEFEYTNTYAQSSEYTGVFRFNDKVTDASCASLAGRVRRYAQRNPGSPITVVINTPGGGVIPGLGLYDELRSIADDGHHLTTQVRGYAASMGAVLLQAGDTRLVGAQSLVMVHEVASGSGGKLHEMENDVDTTKKLNTRLFEIMARRTGGKYTAAKLYAKVKTKDWWLTGVEAVEHGLADALG